MGILSTQDLLLAAAAVLTGSGLKHADLNDLVAAGITAAIVRLAAAGSQNRAMTSASIIAKNFFMVYSS